MAFYEPEPRTTPPEPDEIILDCGHNIYEGESMFDWDGEWLCPDCFQDKVNELSLEEIAELMGVEVQKYVGI